MHTWWIRKAGWFIGAAVLWALAMGYLVMMLWNAVVTDVFHAPAIAYWQAVGLLVLTHILFRGFGRWGQGHGWHDGRWKHKLEEKLAAMTPEEREKFREEYRRRCGWDPGAEKPQ
ncbi:MAG: hypothetical protein A2X67_05005 [Ignavibacteria bacterium GWA2_55_11]|nr:MAG: hypothetical protein A2X67_05005 [Ignavibacteria bacterium GWA2_55_11]OGU44182.1 MAG: hypothetical protein A2X68_13720 [Ignavibacteria bacterium GWC2_56_12]OGU63332.1 MAG: hypothetical protein A3C56_12860 [Ignavibacteria bacterium RIFCSPHIGHO2_02_FULL_56_12]OGU69574.1 MAG: hypothetical protein A3H45_07970 [Ignavibacteria bacterium RIFCSPLOWO2_02_FULL_55_14]